MCTTTAQLLFLFFVFLGAGDSPVNTCYCCPGFLGWWLQLVSLLVDSFFGGRMSVAIAIGDWLGQVGLAAFGA